MPNTIIGKPQNHNHRLWTSIYLVQSLTNWQTKRSRLARRFDFSILKNFLKTCGRLNPVKSLQKTTGYFGRSVMR